MMNRARPPVGLEIDEQQRAGRTSDRSEASTDRIDRQTRITGEVKTAAQCNAPLRSLGPSAPYRPYAEDSAMTFRIQPIDPKSVRVQFVLPADNPTGAVSVVGTERIWNGRPSSRKSSEPILKRCMVFPVSSGGRRAAAFPGRGRRPRPGKVLVQLRAVDGGPPDDAGEIEPHLHALPGGGGEGQGAGLIAVVGQGVHRGDLGSGDVDAELRC